MQRNLEEFKQALEYANALLEPEFTVSSLREMERTLSEASRGFEATIIEEIAEYPAKTKIKALNHYLDELRLLESRAGYLQKEIPWWAVKLYTPEGSSGLDGEQDLAGYLPLLAPKIPALLEELASCCEGQISERNRVSWQQIVKVTAGDYSGLDATSSTAAEVAAAISAPLSSMLYLNCTNEVVRKNFSSIIVKIGRLISEHSANGQNSQLILYAKWFDPLTNLCQNIIETGGFAACDSALQDFVGQIRQVAYERRADVKAGVVSWKPQPVTAPAGELPVLRWHRSVADLAELFYRLAKGGFIDLSAYRQPNGGNLSALCRQVCYLFQVPPEQSKDAASALKAALNMLLREDEMQPGPVDEQLLW